jgi:hypothetical protein
VALKRRADDFVEIFVERSGPGSDAGLGVVALEEILFEREESFLIGVVDDGIGGQRVHQRVGERNPQKSGGGKPGAERDTIGEHGLDVELIENLDRVVAAVFLHRGGLVAMKDVAMRVEDFGRGGTRADSVRLRLEGFDGKSVVLVIGSFALKRGADGMRVIVDRLDFRDLCGELRIDVGTIRRGGAG